MNYSPEVLIYLQMVKKFFQNNQKAKEHYFVYYSEIEFFEKVAEISQKNFDSNGEVMLDIEQFESLRYSPEKEPELIHDHEEELIFVNISDKIFMDIEGYEKICLN